MPVNLDIKVSLNQCIYRASFYNTVCTCNLISQKVVKSGFVRGSQKILWFNSRSYFFYWNKHVCCVTPTHNNEVGVNLRNRSHYTWAYEAKTWISNNHQCSSSKLIYRSNTCFKRVKEHLTKSITNKNQLKKNGLMFKEQMFSDSGSVIVHAI